MVLMSESVKLKKLPLDVEEKLKIGQRYRIKFGGVGEI